ncbi:hypothetical protein [Actinoplanes sp. DH11]|uniref:hypothetical protein n=1 Tax=Actinoplanes sp. DH11 TaxID=2857011 RepID=UPI001E5B5669|nr:hypothetical protein [Actinoplanes sp. DH11]
MRRENVPLTVRLRLVSANSGRPMPGYAVSLWHCDRESRGRQTADPSGWVAFPTAFPGADPGHWPHVHFEVYPGDAEDPVHAAQLAIPGDGRRTGLSLSTDACFTGGWPLEIPSVTGDPDRGLVATRTVGL